jgi:predicted DNA-binding transcriptional regulator AlpA
MLIEQILEQKRGALRASDIAQILDLSEKQIYKMAATGELPSLRIASSVRFDPHDFVVWLKARSSTPEVEPRAAAPVHRPARSRFRGRSKPEKSDR